MHSRRSFLALPVAALAVSGLSACSADDGAAEAGDGTPQDGGTVTFATDVEPEILDPHVSPADIAGAVMRNVFDSLVAQDDKGDFSPWLATSWNVSDDGKAYTFALRRDVTFSDGTPFDAHAVKANFDRIVAPATKSQYAAKLMGPYDRTEIVDAHTARVHLKEAYGSFLHAVSTTYLGFYSPRTLSAHPDELAAGSRYSVGTGPFKLVSRVKGQRLVFERNQGYEWPPPATRTTGRHPHIDKLVVSFLPENATRLGAVTSGQADIADAVPAGRVSTLKSDTSLSIRGHDSPGIVYEYYFNTERTPFHERDARLAVQYAVDTEAITKAVFAGQYDRAWSPLSSVTPGYDALLQGTWRHDPKKAGQLLDGLGWTGRDKDGYRTRGGRRFSVTLLFQPQYTKTEQQTYDTAVQDQLKKVGIELKLVPLDVGAYAPRRNEGDYDMIAFAWGGADPDLLRNVFHSESQLADGGANGSRVRDAAIDGWLDQAKASQDRAARDELYAKVQRRVIEQGFALPAYVGTRQMAVSDRVEGVTFDASAWPLFHDAWVVDGK
ncbi:ABC transporter substrate-binding protein [Streptomyces sp. TS71-3]|uniref:ABC transporter substrate-binding protein n=1 Tax=Streptomyces sp. TS71-3 TaxID=2733862 RepID=UPI001B1E139D|nr:ABC transporter substrate-binding protein [Streptomyces sp. TS71-3]GHJ38962.1 peptide ABC transporter [Streptomyces sp. TS71-3]